MRNRSQKHNQPPRLNRKHSVTIRFGAMHNSVSLDGQEIDLNLRKGVEHREEDRNGVIRTRKRTETPKDNAQRQERVRHDLIQEVFA